MPVRSTVMQASLHWSAAFTFLNLVTTAYGIPTVGKFDGELDIMIQPGIDQGKMIAAKVSSL